MSTPIFPIPGQTGSEFAARLVEALRDAGLPHTQTAIAEQLGVSQACVSKWYNDRAYPTRGVGARASALTNTSLSWLYLGRGAKRAPQVDDYNSRLFTALETLSPEQHADILELVELWASRARARANGDGPKKAHHADESSTDHDS